MNISEWIGPTAGLCKCRFRFGWVQTARAVGEDVVIAKAAAVGGGHEVARIAPREAAVQFTRESSRHLEPAELAAERRLIDDKAILGIWRVPQLTPWLNVSGLKDSLNGYLHKQNDASFRFVLKRV